jgi:hypothetical protein
MDMGIEAFRDQDLKRYTPLAVLGGLVIIGMWVLSAGATQERVVIPMAPPDSEAQKGPVRDIRKARRLSEPAKKADKPAAQQAEPGTRPAAGRDALWADMDPGASDQPVPEVASEPSNSETPGDELVEAVKRAVAERKGGRK